MPVRVRTACRRGAAAVEFALVSPFLIGMLLGVFDYGWFFFRESLITNALQHGMRAGSVIEPATDDAVGECSTCIDVAANTIATEMSNLGITVDISMVTPTIEAIAGTCSLVLEPAIPHDSLIGLVPLPDSYNVRVVAFAQNVEGC